MICERKNCNVMIGDKTNLNGNYMENTNEFNKNVNNLGCLEENILNWYPFDINGEALEIKLNPGVITKVLCNKCKKVVSLELTKEAKTNNYEEDAFRYNLENLMGTFDEIDFKGRKFDYITLIGTLEYIEAYTKYSYIEFLLRLEELLKPNGKLLIATPNKFGMKFFVGEPEKTVKSKFKRKKSYIIPEIDTFGREDINKLLSQTDFKYAKFYYPLPDYKRPELIFSDDYLPTEKTIENYSSYYNLDKNKKFDEIEAYKETIRNNMFGFFANSFLVECSRMNFDTYVDFENLHLNRVCDEAFEDDEIEFEIPEKVSSKRAKRYKDDDFNENAKSWNFAKSIKKIKSLFNK